MATPPKLLTVGRIASELGEPLHRITRVLATRKHIGPVAYAGTLRLFDRRAVAMIRYELDLINLRQSRKPISDSEATLSTPESLDVEEQPEPKKGQIFELKIMGGDGQPRL